VARIKRDIVKKPNPGFQERFASSNIDVVWGGGAASGGKSYGLVLAMAEALMTDPNFRALISRRSLQSQKSGGGFVDTFLDIFGDYVNVKQSDSPRITFPNGAYCDLTYIDDSDLDRMRERAKGWQYDMMAIDELTEMSWEAFTYLQTRNRGRSKTFTGKFFATMNPKRSHWARQFIDWYIGYDGNIIPERDGCVRFFYVNGETVKDVVWGDTKEEVYQRCKLNIDRKLQKIGGDFSYKDLIKSFVFYQGLIGENKELIANNPGYAGSLAASGGRMSQALMEGNWNTDPDEDFDLPVPASAANSCFLNDPAVNGDKWITADLADYGTDNLVALAWNGFHVIDILVLTRTTPRVNAMRVKSFANENGVAESHIIFDATAGRYFNDYLPDAIPFVSAMKPKGIYYLTAQSLKDLCYLRLVKMINAGHITFEDMVAESTYSHQNLKYRISVRNEFEDECSVVRFTQLASGKKKLWNKKQMNQLLGHHRSMDLLDPCAMRMLPCVDVEYGNELETGHYEDESANAMESAFVNGSVFDETIWY